MATNLDAIDSCRSRSPRPTLTLPAGASIRTLKGGHGMGHVLRAPLGHGFAGTPTLATVPACRLRLRGGRGASHERTQTHEPKARSPRARQLVIAKYDDFTLHRS